MAPNADDHDPTAQTARPPDWEEVDLSVLEYLLSLTLAERAEKRYNARLFALRMQQIARQSYGSALDALKAAD